MNKSIILLIIYVFVAFDHLMGILFDVPVLVLYSKPLLMPLLMVYFLVNINKQEHSAYFVIIGAIIFSWFGDMLLMFQAKNTSFFIFGLGSFLISHVFYIVAYRKSKGDGSGEELSKPRLARYDFFLILICLSLIIVLQPHLGEMMIPVIIYAITITFMTITSVHRYGKTSSTSFWMVTIGALLFMFSDSTIAIDKFIEPIPYARLIIMTTYISAQLLIVQGLIKHVKS